LESARDAFDIQPDLLRATVAIVLDIAWPPLMWAILNGMGYFSNR